MVDFTEEDYAHLVELRKEQELRQWEPEPLYLEIELPNSNNQQPCSSDVRENVVIIQL